MRAFSQLVRLGSMAGVLALAACSGNDDRPPPIDMVRGAEQPIPRDRLPKTTSAFEARPCEGFVPGYATECGWVTVAVSPGSSRTLRIDVVRIFSKHPAPEEDPIVYLEGGPGFPGIAGVLGGFEAFEPLLARRDLIVVDQRGTGDSGESLACFEVNLAEDEAELLEALSRCSERLVTSGVDLSAYRTEQSAADVDAVRRALGYVEWNLLGISYGTRLGLTVLRDYPDGVRSAILDSVVPLQVDFIAEIAKNGVQAFEVAFAACARDASCAEHFPEPMEQLERVVLRGNETPLEVSAFEMTGDNFLDLLFNLLYHPVGVGLVPWLIDEVDQGRTDRLDALVQLLYGPGGGDDIMSFGLHLSVQCAEEVAFTTAEAVEEAERELPAELMGGLSGAYYLDYCDSWRVPAAPAREDEPVYSDVPTLLVAGGFDPITPPAYAELVHQDLEGSIFVTLDNLSHGATIDPCGYELVEQFYDDPGAPLRQGCVAEVAPPTFESARAGGGRLAVAGPALTFTTESPTNQQLGAAAEAIVKRRALLRREARSE